MQKTIAELIAAHGSHFVPIFDIHYPSVDAEGNRKPRTITYKEKLGQPVTDPYDQLDQLMHIANVVNWPDKSLQESFREVYQPLPWWKRLFKTKYQMLNMVYQDLRTNFTIHHVVERLDPTKMLECPEVHLSVGDVMYIANTEDIMLGHGVHEAVVVDVKVDTSNETLQQTLHVKVKGTEIVVRSSGAVWNSGWADREVFTDKASAVAYLNNFYDQIIDDTNNKKDNLK